MNRLRDACVAALLMLAATACAAPDADRPSADATPARPVLAEPPPPPPPPDVGDLSRYQACKAPPRRALSERERCQIEKLSARCTPGDDCRVTCLSSPDVEKVGGRCGHECGFARDNSGGPAPGLADCDSLPGPNNLGAGT
ncbi:hypothetical protein [Pseudomonas sp. CGJS7]|uniref:hypothetical protein n=1 Tax=Pseudomonas sp. CGJS7 TaxID=3109348 RepID=UPI00300A9FCF